MSLLTDFAANQIVHFFFLPAVLNAVFKLFLLETAGVQGSRLISCTTGPKDS